MTTFAPDGHELHVKRNSFLTAKAFEPLAVGILAFFVLWARKPSILIDAQLWAEDGVQFVSRYLEHGWLSLFIPAAGYLHLIPRILTAVIFPNVTLEELPFAMNLGALVADSICVALVASLRVPLQGSAAFALAMVFVPHGGEVFGNITNIQWFSALVMFGMLFQAPAETRVHCLRDTTLWVITGLTGPFSVIAVPFAVARLLVIRKTRFDVVSTVCLATAATVQLTLIVSAPPLYAEHTGMPANSESILIFFSTFLSNLVAPVISGNYSSPWMISGVIFLFLTSISCIFLLLAKKWIPLLSIFVLLGIVLILQAITMLRLPEDIFVQVRPHGPGERYTYIPSVLLFWIITAIFIYVREARIAVLGVLFAAGLGGFPYLQAPAPTQYDWTTQVAAIGNDPAPVTIPPGWTFDICRMPCSIHGYDVGKR